VPVSVLPELKQAVIDGEAEKTEELVHAALGDLHDIGKNLVGMMLEGAGFDVIDLGTDVSAQKFVSAVRTHQLQFVGCSALLTTTMPRMKDVMMELEKAGLRDQVSVMVGGAPIT
jgi:5-methyltetrahydrofolate--homocysteine methyltransferase